MNARAVFKQTRICSTGCEGLLIKRLRPFIGMPAIVASLPMKADEQVRKIQMKVAIAQDGNEVSGHFGHCREYAVFTIENKTIVGRETITNPGHEPGRLPALLADHKITHVIAGGMGPKAIDLFCSHNIEVYLGISGPVDSVIQNFIDGNIVPGQSSCHHTHECG